MLNEKDISKFNLIVEYCDYINEILKRIDNDFDLFVKDFEAQQSISFDILQIAESINKISKETKEKYNGIFWHKIIGMRNIIVHEYGAIDYDILFESASHNIPQLKNYCVEILQKEKPL